MEQNKIKILLVDDDEMMRIYFRDIFWIHGHGDKYEVILASSIEEAKKKIKDNIPDTIFLDLMIPIPNGKNEPEEKIKRCLSFIEEIKKDKDLAETKVIIYSGQKDKKVEEEAKSIGADGYLIKGELMPKEIIDFTEKIHGSNN